MKFLIYLFPAMINFVTSGVFFYVTQRFVDAHASKLLTSLVVPMWALTYCVMNVIIGKVVNNKNAAGLIITGGGFIALSSLGFIFLGTKLYLLLAWTGLLGVGFGFYCSPFQVLCKEMEKGSSSGVAMATGKYTAAWSFGFAAGAVVFGMLSDVIAFGLCFAVGVFVAAGVAIITRKLKQSAPAENAEIRELPQENMEKFPDYAWIGWVVGGVVTFSVCQLRSMLQPHAAAIGLNNAKTNIALALTMVSFMQGLTALLLVKSRVWMYKILPTTLFGISGIIAMLLFCRVHGLAGFLLAAAIYGIYSGCGYFIFVFYSLAHPVKAGRNAAINEILVSIASISGPMLGGVLVQKSGISWTPFAMAAACTLLATIFHMTVFAADKRRKSALMEVK